MSAPRNNGPRYFSKAPEPAEVVAERAKAKQGVRKVPQVSAALMSAVTQLRASEQFTEANLRKAFSHYARSK